MKFVAKIKDSWQHTEDSFEAIDHLLEITEDTKISDILEWQKKKFPRHKDIQNGVFSHQIYIIPLD